MAEKTANKKPAANKNSNPERRNGKAWKEGTAPEKRKPRVVVKTEERQRRDELIRAERDHKRKLRIAQHAATRKAREELEAMREEEDRKARIEEATRREATEKLTKAAPRKRAPSKKGAVRKSDGQ